MTPYELSTHRKPASYLKRTPQSVRSQPPVPLRPGGFLLAWRGMTGAGRLDAERLSEATPVASKHGSKAMSEAKMQGRQESAVASRLAMPCDITPMPFGLYREH